MGRFGSCDARTGAQDGFAHRLHGLVLADDALMQHVLQVQQLFALALHQLARQGCPSSGPTMRAISSSVTLSRSRLDSLLGFSAMCFFLCQLLLAASGSSPYLQFGRPCSGHTPLGALDLSVRTCSISSPQLLHLADGVLLVFPLGLHCVEAVAQLGQLLLQLGQTLPWTARRPPSSGPLPRSPAG